MGHPPPHHTLGLILLTPGLVIIMERYVYVYMMNILTFEVDMIIEMQIRAEFFIGLYLTYSEGELTDKYNIVCLFSFYIHESDSLLSPTPEASGIVYKKRSLISIFVILSSFFTAASFLQ